MAYALEICQERDATAHHSQLMSIAPTIATLLATPNPSISQAEEVLGDIDPSLHASIWFALYRITGNATFTTRAHMWSLPPEIPCLSPS